MSHRLPSPRRLWIPALSALVALGLSACGAGAIPPTAVPPRPVVVEPVPTATPVPEAPMTMPAAPADDFLASITLPDGTECLHAGRGATTGFDGMRLNYTCSPLDAEEIVFLMGDLEFDGDLLTVMRGVMAPGEDGFELLESGPITMMVAEVTTADGTVCLHAGRGATLAFDDLRLNYTCTVADAGAEAAEGDVALFGDFSVDQDVVTIVQGVVIAGDDGPALASSAPVTVRALVGVDEP